MAGGALSQDLETEPEPGFDAVRHVHGRGWIAFPKVSRADVRTDADDRQPGAHRFVRRLHPDPPAERILAIEEQPRESRVHDGCFRSGTPVVLRQRAPSEDRRVERLEVARAYVQHEHVGPQILGGRSAVYLEHRCRPVAHHAGRADAGRRIQTLLELREEPDALFRLRILPGGQRDRSVQDAIGIEAQVDPIDFVEAPQHQPGSAQQNERERCLDDNHRGTQATGADAVASRPLALLQEPCDRRPRQVQQRCATEQQRCHDAQPDKERDGRCVDRERNPCRDSHVPGQEVGQSHAARCDSKPGDATCTPQDEALDRQLPNDLPPGGALRESDGYLVRPLRRPRDQEVGDVRAGDEQDERHGAHQREVDQLDGPSGGPVVERLQDHAGALVGLGMLQPESSGDGAQLGLCLLEIHAWAQASDRCERAGITAIERLGRLKRLPEFRAERKLHILGHHADDRRRLAVDAHDASDDRGVRPIPIPPHVETEDHRSARTALAVRGQEIAPDQNRLGRAGGMCSGVTSEPFSGSGACSPSLRLMRPSTVNAARPLSEVASRR